MPNVLQNNKLPIALGKVELFSLFVGCSYTSWEATVLSCCFIWVCSSMPKVLWNNKSQYLWRWLSDSVDFLHVAICILLNIHLSFQNLLFWAGIIRHSSQPIRLFPSRIGKFLVKSALGSQSSLRAQPRYEILGDLLVEIAEMQWLKSDEWSCPLNNDPELTVVQPNNS